MTLRSLLCVLVMLAVLQACTSAEYIAEQGSIAEEAVTGVWAIEPDPDLPNVLILGDSISIGYTLGVRERLASKANVFRPHRPNGERPVNVQGTTFGLTRIDQWLAGRDWDLIHFNWGLHDLKHWDPVNKKNSSSFDDPRQSEPEAYRENLTAIVSKLKATGAKLIFATTTPYPDGVEPARRPSDAGLYNEIALEIMAENGIEINDLHDAVLPHLDKYQLPINVHFNDDGNTFFAKRVADVISQALVSTPRSSAMGEYFSQLAKQVQAPQVYDARVRENGITEFYLDGEDYEGKPTRFFALYRASENPIPLPSGKAPAIVLVHGGAGSAFEEWVEKWNTAGFAAISVAVEGQTDTQLEGRGRDRWQTHDYAGPSRAGIYVDTTKPVHEQWMYHTVSAVIRARNYLESLPEIDADHIGLSGISWGGIITSTVMGFEPEFDFAIPIYGCGFLDTMENQYKRALWDDDVYRELWEPANRISNFTNPSLWLTWREDRHFALDAQAKTYSKLAGDYAISIKPDIGHSHVKGWSQMESYQFAEHVVTHGAPWVEPLTAELVDQNSAQAQFQFDLGADEYEVVNASIHYSTKLGHTTDGEWVQVPAEFASLDSGTDTYLVNYDELPNDVTRWFMNLEVNISPADKNTNESNENERLIVSSHLVTN